MLKRYILIFVFLTLLTGYGFSQITAKEEFVEPYTKGSQTFTISGGLFLPLFFYFPKDSPQFVSAKDHLSLGGTGSLEWTTFLSHRLSWGIELSGTFAFTPNSNTHAIIPLLGEISYLFPLGSFEVPVFFGAGIGVNKVADQVFIGPVLKPGAAIYWNKSLKWGFGIRAQYWIVPEIYFDSPERTSFGNFMDISISARHHF